MNRDGILRRLVTVAERRARCNRSTYGSLESSKPPLPLAAGLFLYCKGRLTPVLTIPNRWLPLGQAIDKPLKPHIEAVSVVMNIPEFNHGQLYKRSDIHDRFGGSTQSGISPSRRSPAIFIFTGESGEQYGYADAWDENGEVFTYTGEGQLGDMKMRAGNLAIANHIEEGRALHLFKVVSEKDARKENPDLVGRGYCRYVGEMQCAGVIEGVGPDKLKVDRKILQFQLVRVTSLDDESSPKLTDVSELPPSASLSLSDLRVRALEASSPHKGAHRNAKRSIYIRAKQVVEYALARAGGICEACGVTAPFLRTNGAPYLEVHHIDRLSDGGLDAPHRVASICPTCHRKIHCGQGGPELNDELRRRIDDIEARTGLARAEPGQLS